MLRPIQHNFNSEQHEERFLFLEATHHNITPSEAGNLSSSHFAALFTKRVCDLFSPVRKVIE
jgi:hypothetical protein